MTLNDINSKINLPAYCNEMGIKGFQFKKIPVFGWFAYTENYDQVNRLFDFLDASDISKDVSYLVKERKNLHEFKLTYSEMSISIMLRDYAKWKELQRMHIMAMDAYQSPKARIRGNYVNLAEELIKQGQGAFMQVQPGLLTKEIADDRPMKILNIPRYMINKTIIPTYCAPGVMCSIEAFEHDNATKRNTLYLNSEKGWIGKTLKGTVCNDIKALQWKEGFVWEQKADYWTKNILDVDLKMPVEDCLTIWKESKNTKFRKSPLDIIELNKKEDEIKLHIRSLSQGQVAELETRFGKDFIPYWKNMNFNEVFIGTLKFIQRNNQYFIEYKGSTDEFTNFTVHVDKIVKRGDLYFRQGYLLYENSVVPFEWENIHFLSSKGLAKKINEIFFEQGVGIPIIYNAYQSFLIDVVNRFNRNVKIEAAS